MLDILYKNDIGIEYMYAFVGKITDEALVILKVENSEEAINVLKENNVRILSANEVYSL